MRWLPCALFLFSLGQSLAGAAPDLAQATVVVYNRADPESAGLARFYAAARQIPNDHLIGLECSSEEEISRQEYDAAIAEPLRKIFAEHKWWTLPKRDSQPPTARGGRIRFVALMRGMPLKIRSTAEYAGDQPVNNQVGTQNNAAVDSELAQLGLFTRQISGPADNPYFQSFRPISELGPSPLLLVTRLDGPSSEVVRRMITDSVATEKAGLLGRAYVDGANNTSGGLADGDAWLKTVVKDLRQAGIPTVYDTKADLFSSGFPLNDCALYYGWYAGGMTGPFTDPGFSFTRGAVAVHIHSFSANSLRAPEANWVAPLLSKGAAASLGNVYEPYLQLTAHLDIFNDRLLHGFTLAESAYMAQRVVSWMNVVVGDPLYRPYATWMQSEVEPGERRRSDWQMYHDFALQNGRNAPGAYLQTARKTAAAAGNGAMLEDLGLIEKEGRDFVSAISILKEARSFYTQPDDILRTVLEQADGLIQAGDKKAALKLVQENAGRVPDGPAAALLRKIVLELDPPPPTPAPSP